MVLALAARRGIVFAFQTLQQFQNVQFAVLLATLRFFLFPPVRRAIHRRI
jgi:hypothetical protein